MPLIYSYETKKFYRIGRINECLYDEEGGESKKETNWFDFFSYFPFKSDEKSPPEIPPQKNEIEYNIPKEFKMYKNDKWEKDFVCGIGTEYLFSNKNGLYFLYKTDTIKRLNEIGGYYVKKIKKFDNKKILNLASCGNYYFIHTIDKAYIIQIYYNHTIKSVIKYVLKLDLPFNIKDISYVQGNKFNCYEIEHSVAFFIAEKDRNWMIFINESYYEAIGKFYDYIVIYNHKKEFEMKKCTKNIYSSGYSHLLINADGNLYGYGSNEFNQLGFFGELELGEFIKIPFFKKKKILQIYAGDMFSQVITTDGVYSFGNSRYGDLGLGDFKKSSIPTRIPFFDKFDKRLLSFHHMKRNFLIDLQYEKKILILLGRYFSENSPFYIYKIPLEILEYIFILAKEY